MDSEITIEAIVEIPIEGIQLLFEDKTEKRMRDIPKSIYSNAANKHCIGMYENTAKDHTQ